MKKKATIFSASRNGNVSDIETLLQSGIDVNKADNLGWCPIHYASLFGKKDAVKCLIEHNADVNKMTDGIITEKGGAGNDKFEIQFMGVTPLIIAARKGYNGIVSILLRAGADPKICDLIGQSASDYANQKTRAVLNYEASFLGGENEFTEEEEEDTKDEDS